MQPAMNFCRSIAVLLLLTISSGAVGCATTTFVEMREKAPNPIIERLTQTAQGSAAPSLRTRQFLRQTGYGGPADFAMMLQHCLDQKYGIQHLESLHAAAEISYLSAQSSRQNDPQLATELSFDAAKFSWEYLTLPRPNGELPDPNSKPHNETRDIYNTSLRSFLRLVQRSGGYQMGQPMQLPLSGRKVRVEIPFPTHAMTLDQLGDFEFVADYELTNLRTRYTRSGVGVPLMIRRRKTDHPLEDYYAEGLSYPVTAVARFDDSLDHSTTLQLFDSRESDGVTVRQTLLPLETDLSTPLAWFLTDPKKSLLDTFAFFRTDKAQKLEGLYMVQPYDPDRIPVLMVHGIWSSPITWMEMFNDLQSDATIRDRYQFWFHLYPTGQPLTFAAAELREELKELRLQLDPYGQNPNLDQMVTVGHSMGGLMSYLMTVDSEDKLWRAMSRLPVSQIQADQKAHEEIRRVFFFESDHSIDRIVTIGSPFQGSGYANRFTRWLSGSLVSLPDTTSQLSRLIFLQNNQSFWDRLIAPRTSVDSLTKNSAILKLVSETEVRPDVKHHNIVGIDRGSGPGDWSDGVVKLHSSSRSDADSEIRVKASHSEVHRHPNTVAEVKRILRLHLHELARANTLQVSNPGSYR